MSSAPSNVVVPALAPSRSARAMYALAVMGLGLSVCLLWLSAQRGGPIPGCIGGSVLGCEHVLRSRWALWLGIPVSALAVFLYGVMLAALLHISPVFAARWRRLAWSGLLVLATIAVGAAVWFVALQIRAVQKLCPYCMAAHACGVALGWLIFRQAVFGRGVDAAARLRPRTVVGSVVLGLAGVAALIAGQLAVTPAEHYVLRFPAPQGAAAELDTGAGPDRIITILGRRAPLRPHQLPVLGSPDAPVLLVYIYDYACPHCRTVHGYLRQARQRFGNRIAVLALPAPLAARPRNSDDPHPTDDLSRDTARLALAVWRTRPEAFEEFDAFLTRPVLNLSVHDARQEARRLIGASALENALADPWIDRQLIHHQVLYHLAGDWLLPKVIAGSAVLSGRPRDVEDFFRALHDEMGVAE